MTALTVTAYALVFGGVCYAVMRWTARRSVLWGSSGALFLGTLFFTVVFPGARVGSLFVPGIATIAIGAEQPVPVPGFAFWCYMLLLATGVLLVVSASEESLRAFVGPIRALLRGDVGGAARTPLLFGAVPLGVAFLVFRAFLPPSSPPVVGRQAHPSIAYDESFVNPLREPTTATLAAFGGSAEEYHEAMTHEGRHLYMKNCSPCHGGKADGTGMVARGLRLPPANFTDPGTIATLVEGYAFKRVEAGGIGLPSSGTPWDSAMPRWKGELTDDEINKILLAEYDLAGVSPRVPERLE